MDSKQWRDLELNTTENLKPILLSLCFHYLVNEKTPKNRAINRVTNFHARNGAILEQINWLGNPSEKGLEESAGIMVTFT